VFYFSYGVWITSKNSLLEGTSRARLIEKKVQLKEDKTNPDIISYGFGEYRTIQDYPIRGRATYLHVRKRKWLDKSSNEIFSYDWDLSEFDGTRLNSEFVSFLKEGD
jgi:transposase